VAAETERRVGGWCIQGEREFPKKKRWCAVVGGVQGAIAALSKGKSRGKKGSSRRRGGVCLSEAWGGGRR